MKSAMIYLVVCLCVVAGCRQKIMPIGDILDISEYQKMPLVLSKGGDLSLVKEGVIVKQWHSGLDLSAFDVDNETSCVWGLSEHGIVCYSLIKKRIIKVLEIKIPKALDIAYGFPYVYLADRENSRLVMIDDNGSIRWEETLNPISVSYANSRLWFLDDLSSKGGTYGYYYGREPGVRSGLTKAGKKIFPKEFAVGENGCAFLYDDGGWFLRFKGINEWDIPLKWYVPPTDGFKFENISFYGKSKGDVQIVFTDADIVVAGPGNAYVPLRFGPHTPGSCLQFISDNVYVCSKKTIKVYSVQDGSHLDTWSF